jgi:hypothetical protein
MERGATMVIEVVPVTIDRFDDVVVILGPKQKPDASVCWCLSHRLDSKSDRQLVGQARGEYVKTLCGTDQGPGVLAFDDAKVAGWAAVAPCRLRNSSRSARTHRCDPLAPPRAPIRRQHSHPPADACYGSEGPPRARAKPDEPTTR